MVNSKVQW